METGKEEADRDGGSKGRERRRRRRRRSASLMVGRRGVLGGWRAESRAGRVPEAGLTPSKCAVPRSCSLHYRHDCTASPCGFALVGY